MTSIPLQAMSHTKLFVDFLNGADTIWNRFEHRAVTSDLITQRSRHGASRRRLVALVEQGMVGIELSAAQQQSLQMLGGDAVVVSTGQQIGLFGGPLYTLLKIASAARLARELSQLHSHAVVPVFWLEDNDHDAAEASSTVLPQDSLAAAFTPWDGTDDRLPVSRRTFSAADIERITALVPLLNGPFEPDVQQLLEGVYREGASWGGAFVRLLQPFLAAWGVLVVRGSDVIAAGLHAPILERDMAEPGALSSLVHNASAGLEALGYHAQATPTHALFFRHDEENRRQRIQPGENFSELARTQPSSFSPNALARPIVQDAVLPTVAVVLGPAEIAYIAQLREVYTALGVPMPVPYSRHSATLLDAKTMRTLGKENLQADTFMRAWQTIESETVSMLGEDSIPTTESAESALLALFSPYDAAAQAIDTTLLATVQAGKASSRNTIESIRGKLRAALKRKNTEALSRRRLIHSFVFPLDSPQERKLPVACLVGRFGIDGLRIIVERVTEQPRQDHVVTGSDDIKAAP